MMDGEAIKRMVRAHSTEVLKPCNSSNRNGLAAADGRKTISPAMAGPPGTANRQPMPNQAGPMQSPDSSVKGSLSRALNPITRLFR